MKMFQRRKSAASHVGRPGRSSRYNYRALRAAYITLPLRGVLLGVVLIVGVVAAAAVSIGASPALPASITAGTLLLIHLVAHFPSEFAALGVGTAYFPFLTPVAIMYSYAATFGSSSPDVGGSSATLAAAVLLTVILARLTSHGKPWATVLFALIAVTFVGPVLLAVVPWLGFGVAYIAIALVLFWRAGGRDKVTGLAVRAVSRLRRTRAEMVMTPVSVRRHNAFTEKRTARILSELDNTFTVFHDRALRGYPEPVTHLVIGPRGVWLIDAQARPGIVRDDPVLGLSIEGDILAEWFNSALEKRDRVANILGLSPHAVQVIVTVHDAVLPSPRTRVSVANEHGELGQVLLCTPRAMLNDIIMAPSALSRSQVRSVVRKARRVLPAAVPQSPSSLNKANLNIAASILDIDGRPVTSPHGAAPTAMFMSTELDTASEVGDAVDLSTDAGLLTGFRVCTEAFRDESEHWQYGLCLDTEWVNAGRSVPDEDEKVQFFPCASVFPAGSNYPN